MKKQLLLFVMILLPLVASADAVEIDGIYYNLITKAKGAEVTSNPDKYSGDIVIPDKITYEGNEYSVMFIGERAFAECEALTSVSIPNSVVNIGKEAFSGCRAISNISIPNTVTSIKTRAFENCSSLISFVIPNSLTTIEDLLFSGCESLASIDIPESITSIGQAAFGNCTSLTSIEIPNNVTFLSTAFQGCSNLEEVIIGEGVTEILNWTFNNCKKLRYLYLGSNIEKVGEYTFTSDATKPFTLKTLELHCKKVLFFLKYTFIKEIIIGNEVTYIKQFINNPMDNTLEAVHISDLKAWCEIDFYFDNNNRQSNPLALSNNCKLYLNGEEVKGELIIPDGTKKISSYAFYSCDLSSVSLPNSVESIESCAFCGCKNLVSITLSNTVKSIGNNAFSGCEKLTSITLPNSITTIEGSTFSGCSSLTSITIPEGVTYIGDRSFQNCIGLTEMVIPNNVTSISISAFDGCSKLNKVTIGSGINNISYWAFANCKELADVYCYANNVPQTNPYIFKDSYIEYATLHVPAGSIDAYSAAETWSYFGTIKAIEHESPGNENGDGYWSTYYNSMGNFEADDNTKVYTASLDELQEKLVLTEVTDKIIKAGQGVILKSTSANANLAYTSAEGTEGFYTNNALKGFDEATTTTAVEGTIYVLGENSSKELGFYKYSGTTLNANKAYLEINVSSARQFYSIDDNTTDISKIMNTPRVTENVFNLQGQQVAHPSKGAYIVNGHKVIIK